MYLGVINLKGANEMNNYSYLLVITVLTLVTGCTQHVQTTSGRAYLERYEYLTSSSEHEEHNSKQENQDINELIKQAAAIEPTLKFPARIGIARIDRGQLSAIPGVEIEAWKASRDKLGKSFGEFIPVSPLVASMTVAATNYKAPSGYYSGVRNVINEIRLGAARQHLDAVLIYEVYSRENSESNVLSIANLTIIGGYILPSKAVTTEGFANALLIDVIQGYPYGTVEVSLDKSEIATTFGKDQKMRQMAGKVKSEVAIKLVSEVEDMFKGLRLELLQKRVGS